MSNTKKNGRKRLVTSLKKAKGGMEILNESRDWMVLGILDVLGDLDKPILVDVFMAYPDLVNEYGMENLYLNKVDFKDATKEELELANFISMLRVLMITAFSLFKKGTLIRNAKNKIEVIEEDNLEMNLILQITDLLSLEDFIDKLTDIKFLIVDEIDYVIITTSFNDKSIELTEMNSMFDHDPKLKASKDILVWFLNVHILIEIIYFIVDYNSKRETV